MRTGAARPPDALSKLWGDAPSAQVEPAKRRPAGAAEAESTRGSAPARHRARQGGRAPSHGALRRGETHPQRGAGEARAYASPPRAARSGHAPAGRGRRACAPCAAASFGSVRARRASCARPSPTSAAAPVASKGAGCATRAAHRLCRYRAGSRGAAACTAHCKSRRVALASLRLPGPCRCADARSRMRSGRAAGSFRACHPPPYSARRATAQEGHEARRTVSPGVISFSGSASVVGCAGRSSARWAGARRRAGFAAPVRAGAGCAFPPVAARFPLRLSVAYCCALLPSVVPCCGGARALLARALGVFHVCFCSCFGFLRRVALASGLVCPARVRRCWPGRCGGRGRGGGLLLRG